MNGTVDIRRASQSDSGTVLAMMREIAAEEGVGDVDVTPEQWHTLLGRDDVIVLIAERDGTAVGYLSAAVQLHLWNGGDIFALDDLYVRPGHRDAGTGRRLMAAIAALAARDHKLIRWGVESDNLDAQRFYTRLGARLHTKTIALWTPEAYRPHLACAATNDSPSEEAPC